MSLLPFATKPIAWSVVFLALWSSSIHAQMTLVGFTLIDVYDNQALQTPLTSGGSYQIILDQIPNQPPALSMSADYAGSPFGSVRFGIDSNPNVQTENVVPYALNGDNAGSFIAEPTLTNPGTYVITATPYSGSSASGAAGTPISVTLEVVSTAGNSPTTAPPPISNSTNNPTKAPTPSPTTTATHPDVRFVVNVPGGVNPAAGWADSYSVGDRCYCESTFDHNIGTFMVETDAFGWQSVEWICAALGPGPGSNGRPRYNDMQCGNGPPNDAGDEHQCPGRVDIGQQGCGHIGPRWNFTNY
ncbi:hypothetical protein ACA910_017984 [Epithemia clementina (nom. ined.)]